jgi:tetratricopeptide (TPR) repeat protein
MPLKNKEARAAYKKDHREKNKEAYKAYSKTYREKNKEAIAAYQKAYREKNKEAIAAYIKDYQEKNKEAIKAYREKNKEARAAYQKAYDVLKRYGITLAEKKKMQDEQGNKCKICYQDFPSDVAPNVDHCHTSGKVRGLLCWNCNIGLGSFKDNPLVLIKAAEYLKEQGEEDVR